jgi:hypothetical protein
MGYWELEDYEADTLEMTEALRHSVAHYQQRKERYTALADFIRRAAPAHGHYPQTPHNAHNVHRWRFVERGSGILSGFRP